ncbi:thiolase [Tilletiaria anomala UBC 951]|uniref:acetyl-CoA C-acyltransferase n=1 Tax=Tilletiaria anomala (strain ATCC 24038 / CBS 436.72 / UBC 951) TaxID=1037660 RepID=A0A066VEX7_TILAU|nr:thiolase [Tilletiaria anomala UBC 951]KDN37309.1 thiolase [Tilletiaria anomala UBC 951]
MSFRASPVSRQALANILKKRPDDIVFTTGLRTPIARVKKGLKDAYPEELLAHVLQKTRERLEKRGVDVKNAVQDICTGTVLMELGGAKSGRMAALHAGMPIESAYRSVNRQCASSLQSITDIAHSIKSGEIQCGVAAGVESMTRNYGSRAIPVDLSPTLKQSASQDARDCIMPMGETSERVAEHWNIGRQRQDQFAALSHQRASKAQKAGLFAPEIEPILVRWVEPESGTETVKTIAEDEGIRHDSSAEKLGTLKPVFRENGASTAGNSSQVSDGAVALTMARRDFAEQAGMEILGKWVGTAVKGVKPHVMGIGPAVASPILLARFGLTVNDIDLWELNEAFASQALMTIDTLKLDAERVNPKGGAIALGHPLGASGGRLVLSLLTELRRTGKDIGVATMCCGTGYGKASLIVAEQ